jgi:hypothetical protein
MIASTRVVRAFARHSREGVRRGRHGAWEPRAAAAIGALLAFACVLPAAAGTFTTTESPLVVEPGDQFDPAISGRYVSFTDTSNGSGDVWYADTSDGSLHPVAVGPGAQHQADVSGSLIAYVDDSAGDGSQDVFLYNIVTGTTEQITKGQDAENPVVSDRLVAYQRFDNGLQRNVWVHDLATGVSQPIDGSGPQFQWGAAVSGSRVAYIEYGPNGTPGPVEVWDATTGISTTVAAGSAFGPDIDGGDVAYVHSAFVDPSTAELDIAVTDLTTGQTRTLSLPGAQENPKISGDFVAFLDVSSGLAHICLWHWTSGDVLCPATPAFSQQVLSDLSGNTLVYSDDRNGNLDLYATRFTFSAGAILTAQVQQPVNADGSSVFSAKRGVVPIKFTLAADGTPTCDLPPATIALTRTSGGTTGSIDESIYSLAADSGTSFRIDSCQYVYNLAASAPGQGSYRVDILINGTAIGSARFDLK